MAKTRSKKKSATRKTAPATRRGVMPAKAAKAFAELSFAVAQGMHDGMMADAQQRRYVLDDAARDYWLNGHARSVPKALTLPGRSWSKDRKGVVFMATKLGRTAVDLAYQAAGAATGLVRVTEAMAKAASAAVKRDPHCVAFAKRTKGGGVYCDF